MYNDWLKIGPITIHGYGACIAIGLLAALFMASYRGKKRKMNDDIVYGIVFCAAIFGFLSAKIMYCIVEWKDFIKDPLSFITSSGFVVFGGITGGIFAIFNNRGKLCHSLLQRRFSICIRMITSAGSMRNSLILT